MLAEDEEPFADEEEEGVVDAVDAELPLAAVLGGDFFLDFLDFFLFALFPLAKLWLVPELELESEITMLAPLKGTHFMFEFAIVEEEKDGVLLLLLLLLWSIMDLRSMEVGTVDSILPQAFLEGRGAGASAAGAGIGVGVGVEDKDEVVSCFEAGELLLLLMLLLSGEISAGVEMPVADLDLAVSGASRACSMPLAAVAASAAAAGAKVAVSVSGAGPTGSFLAAAWA